MRDQVLVRKKAGLILLLAKRLRITPERALALFYPTNTNRLLSDARYGLQLMSNQSLLRDLVEELAEVRKVESAGAR